MKIGKIETFYVPPRWLFVRVESDDGAVGWGEASLEGWAEAVDGAFEALRDRFLGHDPFRIEDIWQIGYRGGFYRGGAVLMSALAGLEQALWDLKGRALGLPASSLCLVVPIVPPSHYDMAHAREQEQDARKRLQKEEVDLGSQGEGQESA